MGELYDKYQIWQGTDIIRNFNIGGLFRILFVGAFAEVCDFIGWETLALISSVIFWVLLFAWVLAFIMILVNISTGNYDKQRQQEFKEIMETLRWL